MKSWFVCKGILRGSLFLSCMLSVAAVPASDHFDGPRTAAHPAADIADVYVARSPTDANRLVLGMTIHPFANEESRFSESVNFIFRLRTADRESLVPGDTEYRFTCSFHHAEQPGEQTASCISPGGDSIVIPGYGKTVSSSKGFKGFFGLRSDPFFMNYKDVVATVKTGRLQFKSPAEDGGKGLNVLALVLEFDRTKVLGKHADATMAVVGDVLTLGNDPIRVDYFGRPEITNVILSAMNFDKVNQALEIRDIYNAENAFATREIYVPAYMARFDANLHFWDMTDGIQDWKFINDHHPLSAVLLKDYLLIDLSRPFEENTYFALESAQLHGQKTNKPGGRWFNDNTPDTQFTLMVTRGREPVTDFIDSSAKPAGKVFPYLQPPNLEISQ